MGIAWADGAGLYLYLPSRHVPRPPTHPGIILTFLVASVPLTYWFRQNGVYLFILMTVGILAGSVVGFFVYGWVPSSAQHLLVVATIVTSVYAWKQKSYFEE